MISAVIPTYNGLQHLQVCFDSLKNQTIRMHTQVKVVLVDNGSSDSTREFVKTNYPDVELISLDKNYGFA